MKIAFFSAHRFEKKFFVELARAKAIDLAFFETSLNAQTAPLVENFDGVCCFVSDHLNRETLQILSQRGVRLVALRSAGYNNIDLQAAESFGLRVVRVPSYSPHAVAEHAVGLLLSLNRKIHKAYARVRDFNFSLDGLIGFDLVGKTVGVIGTGRIGSVFGKIMTGFGCEVLAFDRDRNPQNGFRYVELNELYRLADIISLHLPLVPETHHMINEAALKQMKPGAILINTGRGALIDSTALVESLKCGQLGGACLDVYEEEDGVFFQDLSEQIMPDDVLLRLLTFPNVLMTSHQAFLTEEALARIAEITLNNIVEFSQAKPGVRLSNEVQVQTHLVKENQGPKSRP